MPEESEIGEVGVDKLADETHERAREEGTLWMRLLALSTALFAVVAAVASLHSGHHANEALLAATDATLAQAEASDQWSYYQAKGIKSMARESQADLLTAMHAPDDLVAHARIDSERYRSEQEEIEREAKALEVERKALVDESRHHLRAHQRFSYAVTALQVAIGLSAVAALIRRRSIWLFALLIGGAGTVLFAVSFLGA